MKTSVTGSSRDGNAIIIIVSENNMGHNFLINLASDIDNDDIDLNTVKK